MHTRDLSSIPGSRSSLGELQFSGQLTPVSLPGKFHEQRSLGGCMQSMGSQRLGHHWVCTHAHTCVCMGILSTVPRVLYSNWHYYNKDKGNTRCYEIEDLILSMGWKMSHIANYASSWYLKTGLTAIKHKGKQNTQNIWNRKVNSVLEQKEAPCSYRTYKEKERQEL